MWRCSCCPQVLFVVFDKAWVLGPPSSGVGLVETTKKSFRSRMNSGSRHFCVNHSALSDAGHSVSELPVSAKNFRLRYGTLALKLASSDRRVFPHTQIDRSPQLFILSDPKITSKRRVTLVRPISRAWVLGPSEWAIPSKHSPNSRFFLTHKIILIRHTHIEAHNVVHTQTINQGSQLLRCKFFNGNSASKPGSSDRLSYIMRTVYSTFSDLWIVILTRSWRLLNTTKRTTWLIKPISWAKRKEKEVGLL